MIRKTGKIVSVVLTLCLLLSMTALAEQTGSQPIFTDPDTKQSATASQSGSSSASAASAAKTSTGRNIDPSKPMIAITYDDGPCTGPGYRIIEVFEKYGQRCTFFVVGERLAELPSRVEELQRMVSSGFEIGNHSYDHEYFNSLTDDQIRQEVSKCNAAIQKYAGVTPTVMRLPGGTQSERIRAAVSMPIILWNIDTEDWKTRNADSTVSKVLGKVKDGDIVLMHELYNATAEATERLVPALVEQGFQLVTVSELAKYKGVTLQNSKVYYSF